MKSYYHWTSWRDVVEGQLFGTSWDESSYWKHKKVASSAPKEALGIPESLQGFVSQGVPSELLEEFQRAKLRAELEKELFFENIRENEFPELPSRKLCLFAFPTSVDPHEFRKRNWLAPRSVSVDRDSADRRSINKSFDQYEFA